MKHLNYFPCIATIAIIFFNSCSKQESIVLTKPSVKVNSLSTDAIVGDSVMVFTPFGPRLKADVHHIADGHRVGYINGHLDEIDIATGKVINDFGVPAPLKYLQNGQNTKAVPALNTAGNKQAVNAANIRSSFAPTTFNPNWKTWAEATQTKEGLFSSQPFPQSFSTNYTVPSLPTNTTDGQIIFIYNGLEDDSLASILQPVLQYGNNGYGGSSTTWQILSYYVPCGSCVVEYSTATSVSPGDYVDGEMQQTGTSGSNDWTSYFYKNNVLVSSLPVTAMYPLTTLFETLETNTNVTKTTDYPPQDSIVMTATAGTGNPVKNFTAATNSTAVLGEHTVVPTQSQVDIYFRAYTPPPPPPTVIAEIDISLGDTTYYWLRSGTVSGGSTTNSTQYRLPASYTLPSGEIPSTIVGIAIASSGWSYYWYADGTLSAGSTTNASSHEAPKSYSLPAGETISDIVSISISKNTSETYVWYKDGTFSVGSTTNFGSISSGNPYTVATGESISTVVGIGIAGSNSHVYAWYSDKTVSQGTATKFDNYAGTIPASF